MERKEYNGWTNYETWCVNLWLDNEQGSQEYWTENALQALRDNDGDQREATEQIEVSLQEHHEEAVESFRLQGVFADLLTGALQEVNWQEIASYYIEAAQEEYDLEREEEESE